MPDHRPLDGPTRVLCVGADIYLTDLLRYALTREGCAVEVAASGDEAASIAGRWRPHAAVVDGDLPDLGGRELCSRLRAGCGVAAILLTTGGDGNHADDTPHLAGHRLAKPFRLHALVGALESLLQPAVARL